MRFEVLNVGHGLCAYLEAENKNLMVFDCGYNGATGFKPSDYFRRRGHSSIQRFIVTNYDQDHIDDLPDLKANFNIEILHRNSSISSSQLRVLKRQGGPISDAMECLLDMIDRYNGGEPSPPPPFPGVTLSHFWNSYKDDFDDTNNISLVTFLNCNETVFVIPGDLEKAGWEKLLKNASFRSELAKVNYFIASHHGRENGYCEEVFNYCTPKLVIMSDGPKRYATQEMVSTYTKHASGVKINGKMRYVWTTRSDGVIHWDL
ncbi:MAG: hypothetical protein AAGF93_01395 [Cyanobacteria bacterium P01_H01_bin.105]